MSDISKLQRRERAIAMRNLSDEERDELIDSAENVVDARARFGIIQRQVALRQEYRKPVKPRGAA